MTTSGSIRLTTTTWRNGQAREDSRDLPEETPVALVYDASAEAVMMATPLDLEDFALGFSLTEGLITTPDDIARLDIVPGEKGIEARMWLKPERSQAMTARRRSRAGPTGCGLCGIDSLNDVVRLRGRIDTDLTLTAADVAAAIAALEQHQTLGRATRAVHAAGFWTPQHGCVAVREDVGRHNALDKLVGALARAGVGGAAGAIVLTSRVSIEMVQKAVALRSPVLIAVSAPTAMAVRVADECGLTIAAVARGDGFEVFTHSRRITF